MKINLVYITVIFELVFSDTTIQQVNNRNICPAISIKNGKVIRRRQRGRFVKFACTHGYLLAGERHSTCVRGTWDPPPPKCVRGTCMNKVQHPVNGLIYPSHNGAALHFFCRAGYTLKGPSDVFCDGRKWDNNAPICIPVGEKPKLFCDFEDIDICSWTPDLNHDFDWKRLNFNTPSGSIGTGPSHDHTKGFGQDGHYMYIESSSRNINDTAKLISPLYNLTNTELCFEFYYHMFGITMGSLRVYVKRESQDWNLQPENAFLSKSGNQGDKWYRAFRSLGVIDEEFQIIIEGVRGDGYVSDIAIDDVRIIPNCTKEIELSSTAMPTDLFITDDITQNVPTVDSCENRCGETEGTVENHITCDCDDSCFDHNRCCPDFFDYCFSGSTVVDDYASTDMSNDVETNQSSINQQRTTNKSPSYSPITVNTIQSPETTRIIPTTIRSLPIFTRYATKMTTTAANMPFSTRLSTYIKPVTKPKLISKPIIYIEHPPSTPEIIRKVMPLSTLKPTLPTKISYPRITTVAYIPVNPIFNPARPYKEVEQDFEEVTIPRNNDEVLFITSPIPEYDYSKEYVDEQYNFDSPSIQNFNETNKLFSQRSEEAPTYNVMLLVISLTSLVMLTSAVVIFVILRRYRRPGRINFSANGDSQSDVRYLTSDETLDFSLDNDLYGELK